MQPLISIIVPVYKVEDCLDRCLNSLCRQSMTEIEILLIDDASPDRCGEICEAYAKKDARYRVFRNQVNQGLSVARNIGIANASCNWLMFVDSDDWVHEDFCKDAYESAVRYKADLVLFRFQCVMKNKCCGNNKEGLLHSGYKTQMEAIDLLQKEVGHTAWNKLYRKELFRDITYPPGYLFEDRGTTYKTVLQASRIYFLNKILYYKCYRAGSITATVTEKSLQDKIEVI